MADDQRRPNILFILADDQGAWAMGCAGNPEIHTPCLDRLAASGIRCSSFFCASPVCSPARASILTGRIPSSHGVHDWIRSGNLDREELTEGMREDPIYSGEQGIVEYLAGMTGYTDVLNMNGYICGLSGKWHLGASTRRQKGFDWWRPLLRGGCGYYQGDFYRDGMTFKHPGYVTNAITDGALEFLEQAAGREQPFYLSLHYTAPHTPWDRNNHPREFLALYEDCPFRSCPKEPVHPLQITSCSIGDTEEQRKDNIRGYYAAISAMDAQIGRVLDRLDELGIREDTLVIFTSDNGMNLGHHGIWGKGNGTFPQNFFDTSVKVPFLASWPGVIPEGIISDAMLSHYDLLPTLMDLLGMEFPPDDRLPGRSFAGILLSGMPEEDRDPVVICDEYGPGRMIRTRKYKYIHRFPYGPHEFYDLAADPGEQQNLAEDPAAAGEIQRLRARLTTWFLTYADEALDGTREPVTGMGQLGMAGVPGEGRESFVTRFSYFSHDKAYDVP